MTFEQAKEVLGSYRADLDEIGQNPELEEALRRLDSDADLKDWFEDFCQRQDQIRRALRSLPVPPSFRDEVLMRHRTARFSKLGRTGWAALAAGLALILGLTLWERSDRRQGADFENFRARMVGTALREYRMDIHTAEESLIRKFLQEEGAPWNFALPKTLAELPRLGAGKLTWNGAPVAMVCFDRGEANPMFLFIVPATAAEEEPAGAMAEMAKVNKLHTASWSDGENAFLLASHERVSGFFPSGSVQW